MTEWTTIRVRQDAKDDADDRKPDDMTWSEWITDDERGVDLDIGRVQLDAQEYRKIANELVMNTDHIPVPSGHAPRLEAKPDDTAMLVYNPDAVDTEWIRSEDTVAVEQ